MSCLPALSDSPKLSLSFEKIKNSDSSIYQLDLTKGINLI